MDRGARVPRSNDRADCSSALDFFSDGHVGLAYDGPPEGSARVLVGGFHSAAEGLPEGRRRAAATGALAHWQRESGLTSASGGNAPVEAGAPALSAPDAWRHDRALLALLAVGLLLRIVASVWTDSFNRFLADDLLYLQQTEQWRDTGVLETGPLERPPGYFTFLYLTSFLTGTGPAWHLLSKVLQSVAGAAATIPIFALADRAAGRQAARIAAAFYVFDPTMIGYCAMLWPETLYTLLTAIVFWRTSLLGPGQVARPIVLGVLTGLAMLLKPAIGAFTVMLALSWLWRFGWGGAIRLALIFATATALVLAPWVIRNQLRYGPEILLENEAPYNLWMGSHWGEPQEVFDTWHGLPDPLTRARVASEMGWKGIRDHPADYARRSIVRGLNLWGLEWFITRNLSLEAWGKLDVATFLRWFWVIQLAYIALLLAAAAGLRETWHDSHMKLLLSWMLFFTALVAGLVATTRFRMPFHPILAILAGVGIARGIQRRLQLRDLVPLGLATAVLVFSFQRPLFELITSSELTDLAQLNRSRWVFFWY